MCVVADSDSPRKPDAVFPNNWVSFHADGTVVLYPMHAENRRAERRPEIIDAVVRETGFKVRRVLDLTRHEKAGRFLEGTGSLVLDHRGARGLRLPLAAHRRGRGARMGARDGLSSSSCSRPPMSPARPSTTPTCSCTWVHASRWWRSTRSRRRTAAAISERLAASGREVLAIDHAEMRAFAGNMLEVGSWDEYLGDFTILVMSETARHALATPKYKRLYASVDAVLAVPIEMIERHGGGSVRCMLAEIFLP